MTIYAVKAGSLSIAATTAEREYLATWLKKPGLTNVDTWTVRWWYRNSKGQWIQEGDASVSAGSALQSLYSPPDEATHIRVYVKAVAKTVTKKVKKNGKTTTTTTTPWVSDWRKASKKIGAASDETAEDYEVTAPGVTAAWQSGGALLTRGSDVEADWADELRWYPYRWLNGAEGGSVPSAAMAQGATTGYLDADTVLTSYTIPSGSYARFAGQGWASDGVVSVTAWDDDYSPAAGDAPIYGTPAALESFEVTGSYDSGVQMFSASWEYPGEVWAAGDIVFELRWSETYSALLADDGFDGSEKIDTGACSYSAAYTGDADSLYFACRAVNDDSGAGEWSTYGPVPMGAVPSAPTFAALSPYVETGAALALSWTHNCEDGAAQAAWELQASGASSAYIEYSGYTLYFGASNGTGGLALRIGAAQSEGTAAHWALTYSSSTIEYWFTFPCDAVAGDWLVAAGDTNNDVYELLYILPNSIASSSLQYYGQDQVAAAATAEIETMTEAEYDAAVLEAWSAADSGEDATNSYSYAVTADAGAQLRFRCRTASGAEFGEWGYSDSVTVLAPMSFSVTCDEEPAAMPVTLHLECDCEVRLWHVLVTYAEGATVIGEDGEDEAVAAGAVLWEGSVGSGDDGFDSLSQGIALDVSECTPCDGVRYEVTADAVSVHGMTAQAQCEFTPAFGSTAPQPDLVATADEDLLTAHLFPACWAEVGEAQEGAEIAVTSYDGETMTLGLSATYAASVSVGETIELVISLTEGGWTLQSASVTAYAAGESVTLEADADTQTVEALGSVWDASALFSEAYESGFIALSDALDVFAREDVTFYLYRADSNGDLLELASDVPNTGAAEVVDWYAPFGDSTRYRVRALAEDGTQGFADCFLALNCDDVVLTCSTGSNSYTDGEDEDGWTFDEVRIPYEVTVSESYEPDLELVEYIGNTEPTAYHGTQRGASTSVSGVVMEYYDEATVSALRRFMGDLATCFYRDPGGLAFGAAVTASEIERSYDSHSVGVKLDVARVDWDYSGGVYEEGAV